jgi:3-hydroxyacyl-CoA dehydrogenase/enoyl-CoA hydratase/3-hydroxybutyryl-CoA epimerase
MNMINTRLHGAALSVLLAAGAINPLSRLFQRELSTLLEQLEVRRGQLAAVIIGFNAASSTGSHELAHLMALTPAQAADCMHMLDAYNALLQRLEGLGIPVIAALGGEVSGHALGLALACHRRFGLHDACA